MPTVRCSARLLEGERGEELSARGEGGSAQGGGSAREVCLLPSGTPPRGQTDTCENITFPQLLLRTVTMFIHQHHSFNGWCPLYILIIWLACLFTLSDLTPIQIPFPYDNFKMVNSFVLLTFDKAVILEVSRTGTINLALRPDVYCIIFQSLEVLSRLKVCFFYAMDAWPP